MDQKFVDAITNVRLVSGTIRIDLMNITGQTEAISAICQDGRANPVTAGFRPGAGDHAGGRRGDQKAF